MLHLPSMRLICLFVCVCVCVCVCALALSLCVSASCGCCCCCCCCCWCCCCCCLSSVLPSGIVEEIFLSLRHMAELQAVYLSLRGAQSGELSPCSSMDAELIAAACIAVMGSPTYFRSVHTRCDGSAVSQIEGLGFRV